MAALSAELNAMAAARKQMHAERARMAAAGLVHPDEAKGAILAGAEATNYVQIGRNQFGQTMVNVEPLDSPVIITRNTAGSPQGRYYLANGLAIMSEGHDEWSCQGALFVEMQATDHPNANVDGLTAMDSAVYVKVENRGKVAGFAFHTDTWHHGSGTTLSFNSEVKRTSPDGTAISYNAQADVDSAPYPGDIPYLINGPWKRGVTRVNPGEIFGFADAPLWVAREDGAQIVGYGPIGNFALDKAGSSYWGPVVDAAGHRAVHVLANGTVEIWGTVSYRGKKL